MAGNSGVLRFSVFGPVSAWRDGVELDLGGPKQRAVLAILVLSGDDVVSVDRIVDAVWGDDPPARAVETVQVSVSRLRRAIATPVGAPGSIAHVRPGYRIRLDGAELDFEAFRRIVDEARDVRDDDPYAAICHLARALELWRGEPLADVSHLPGLARMAVRLREVRANLTEDFLAMRLRFDQAADLVADLEDAVAAEPFRERRWAQLISALRDTGRRGDALRKCGELRHLLRDEFGIEPCGDILALEGEIRANSARRSPELPAAPYW